VGEEGTELRLIYLEEKAKARDKKQDDMNDKIVVIEKINIRQEIILNSIMWSLKIIAAGFITFVGTNLYMFL